MCDQSCCVTASAAAYEVSADARARGPGDVVISAHIQGEAHQAPGSRVWAPLEAAVLGIGISPGKKM